MGVPNRLLRCMAQKVPSWCHSTLPLIVCLLHQIRALAIDVKRAQAAPEHLQSFAMDYQQGPRIKYNTWKSQSICVLLKEKGHAACKQRCNASG